MNLQDLNTAAENYSNMEQPKDKEVRHKSFIAGAEWARQYYIAQYFCAPPSEAYRHKQDEEDWTPTDPMTGRRDRSIRGNTY